MLSTDPLVIEDETLSEVSINILFRKRERERFETFTSLFQSDIASFV